MMSRDCPNCGATVKGQTQSCDRCGEAWGTPGSGAPRFSKESRDAGESLGGLLTLHSVLGNVARYVGRCPAGLFGLSQGGDLVWINDVDWVSSVTFAGSTVVLNGAILSVDTGKPEDPRPRS
jgi:hypothetical protein